MTLIREVEVHALVLLLQRRDFVVCAVLENQLFQEVEGALVRHSLADLDISDPEVRGPGAFAVVALQVADNELDDARLLQYAAFQYFLLDG